MITQFNGGQEERKPVEIRFVATESRKKALTSAVRVDASGLLAGGAMPAKVI